MPFSKALRPAALLCLTLLPPVSPEALASSSPVLDRILDTGIVRLAHRESAIPFSYYDLDRQPVGYALDLCQRVVEKLLTELKRPDSKVRYR